MAFNISTARKLVRYSARNASDTSYYPTFLVDLAIQRAANQLIRDAHLLMRTDTINTVNSTSTYTPVITFRPERLDSVWLTGANVQVNVDNYGFTIDQAMYIRGGVNYPAWPYNSARLAIVDISQLNDYIIGNPQSGQPQCIAFNTDYTFTLYPQPDNVYTINYRWSDFFTTWNIGEPVTTFTNTAGVLSNVVVTDGSNNLGASIAASWVDPNGSGSGATATAVLANGVLTGVTVGGAGGTNYTSATQLLLGGFNSADQTLNLPDDHMYEILTLGAPSYLCMADPEKKFATEMGEQFRAYVEKIKGAIGGLGVKRIIRRTGR